MSLPLRRRPFHFTHRAGAHVKLATSGGAQWPQRSNRAETSTDDEDPDFEATSAEMARFLQGLLASLFVSDTQRLSLGYLLRFLARVASHSDQVCVTAEAKPGGC